MTMKRQTFWLLRTGGGSSFVMAAITLPLLSLDTRAPVDLLSCLLPMALYSPFIGHPVTKIWNSRFSVTDSTWILSSLFLANSYSCFQHLIFLNMYIKIDWIRIYRVVPVKINWGSIIESALVWVKDLMSNLKDNIYHSLHMLVQLFKWSWTLTSAQASFINRT